MKSKYNSFEEYLNNQNETRAKGDVIKLKSECLEHVRKVTETNGVICLDDNDFTETFGDGPIPVSFCVSDKSMETLMSQVVCDTKDYISDCKSIIVYIWAPENFSMEDMNYIHDFVEPLPEECTVKWGLSVSQREDIGVSIFIQ